MTKVGSRAAVMHGNADHTTGGLTKKDLKYNKWGRIVSVKKSQKAKKENRLSKLGFKTQKGKFGIVKANKTRKNKRRGGGYQEDVALVEKAGLSDTDQSIALDILATAESLRSGKTPSIMLHTKAGTIKKDLKELAQEYNERMKTEDAVKLIKDLVSKAK